MLSYNTSKLMNPFIHLILRICWLTLILYWTVSSFKAKKSTQEEGLLKRIILYWLPLIVGALLLGPGEWFGHMLIRENFVPHTNFVGAIGLCWCIAGVFIACWSRYILGKNWSLAVQLKHEHELVVKGPYRLVRHPIYTGLLFLFIGNTLIVGDWRGIIAVAIVFVSFWYKLKKEEEWLFGVFGEQYIQYKENTKALIPYLI